MNIHEREVIFDKCAIVLAFGRDGLPLGAQHEIEVGLAAFVPESFGSQSRERCNALVVSRACDGVGAIEFREGGS